MTDEERKKKWENFKNKVKWKVEDAWDWCKKNPIEAATIGFALLKGGERMNRQIQKKKNLKEERELKDRYIYDMSARHYVKTKRELTNKEWMEFDRRRAMGEPVSWILNDMRLL